MRLTPLNSDVKTQPTKLQRESEDWLKTALQGIFRIRWSTGNSPMIARTLLYLSVWAGVSGLALAQEAPLTLQDALARAKQYGGQIQTANFAVREAAEDTLQARAA